MSLPATYRVMKLISPGAVSNLMPDTYALRPPRDNEIVVKVDACAVAYRDVLDRTGAFKFIRQPTVLGHEFHGRVVAAGAGVRDLNCDDEVLSLHWDQSQAWPSPLRDGGAVDTMFGLTCDGGYGEYCTAAAGAFAKVVPGSTDLSATQLACVMSTFGTVWQGAVVRARLQPRESVLVTGASGGVGSAAVLISKAMGCTVTGVTSSPQKAAFLRQLGCSDVVVCDSEGAFKAKPHAMVIEAVGGPTFASSLRATAPGGRMVLVGNVENSVANLPLGYCILNSVSIIGSDSIERATLSEVLLPFMKQHQLRPVVDRVLPLERVGEAHHELQSRSVRGRIVIDPTL